jgi:hypothetical protein
MSLAPINPTRKRKAADTQVIPFRDEKELKESVYKLFETKKQLMLCSDQITKLRKIVDSESKRIQLYMETSNEQALAIDADKLIYHKTNVKKPNPTYDDAYSSIKELFPDLDMKLIEQQVERKCEEKKEVVHTIETQMLMFKKI